MRELRLGKAGQAASARVLRERRKGDGLGDHVATRRPAFFDKHTLSELEQWPDHDLEEQGRLTHPMRWDAASDKYVPVSWAEAFEEIGRELRALDPHQVDLLHLGPRVARDELHVPTVRAHVRQQQHARQFEHVSRELVGGASREHRRIGRHRDSVRLRKHRLHFLHRPERRHVVAAPAARSPGCRRSRREDRHLQPAARARP